MKEPGVKLLGENELLLTLCILGRGTRLYLIFSAAQVLGHCISMVSGEEDDAPAQLFPLDKLGSNQNAGIFGLSCTK